MKTSPLLLEIPDSVVPPVALLVSLVGASTRRSGMPMKRPRWVESMMMRLSTLSTGNWVFASISQESLGTSTEYNVASNDAFPTTA